ncbi:type VII secretion protein EsaA [uncultured Granulicatella sp.]|uniref:type VII secretion protein EsaA n=1 Tax=uncultured Granulicatella sp. TaxID=316089 RepID=UPI002607D01B|nr:type VII secretion protein EsaA [uncultured Granulicatella sp.]
MKHKKVFLFSGVLLVLVLLLALAGIVKPQNTSRTSSTQEHSSAKNDVSIAIVNEDSGTTYNGDQVSMANVLIDSFAKTTPYKVETVSRSTAEKGLENGNYQVMVIMPSHFSQDALSLEETAPKRALFQYKVNADKQVLVKQAEQAVSDLKQAFNQDMIRIYFSSVIANLKTAQNQVMGVVKNQGDTVSQFEDTLLNPLTQYSQQFTGLSNSSKNATEVMENFNTVIQNTNTSFTQIISVNKTYDEEIARIKQLQDAWTQSVLKRENELAVYDKGISSLTVNDPLKVMQDINSKDLPSLNNSQDLTKILENSNQLNQRLNDFLTDIKKRNEEISTYLSTTYKEKIKQAVAESLSDNSNQTKKTLGLMVSELRNNIDKQVISSAKQISLYDDATIDRMALPEADKQFLKNTVHFVQKVNPSATVQTSRKDEFVNTKQNEIKNKPISGAMTISEIAGKVKKIVFTVDSHYTLQSLTIDGQNVSFTQNGASVEVTSGFNSSAKQLRVAYELKHKNESISETGWFAPIASNVKVITEESIAHLSDAQKQALLSNVSKLNESIKQSNKVIQAFNTYQESGAATPQKFNSLNALDENSVTVNASEQAIQRIYSESDTRTVFTDSKQFLGEISSAVFNDVKSYLEFAGQVKAVYGVELYSNRQADPKQPASDSLYAQLALDRLDEVLVDLVTNTLTNDVKDKLVIPSEFTTETSALSTDVQALKNNIDAYQKLMRDVNAELTKAVAQTQKVKETLESKPIFVDSEKRDNTDLTNVGLAINKDLATLMQASRSLMDNTKNHQQIATTIRQEYNRLNEDVKSLENKGTEYKNSVATMDEVMAKEYESNSSFLKEFTQVMSNTQSGNTANTVVYDYLSHPVDGSMADVRSSSNSRQQTDNRTGVLMVLIIAVMTLAFVYMLQHGNWQILETNKYLSNQPTVNFLPLALLAGIGALIGLFVSVVVGMKLNLPADQLFVLCGVSLVIGVSIIFMHHALMTWLKAYGLLVSLAFVVIYVISLGQLFDTYYGSVSPLLTYLTPFISAEEMLHTVINQQPTSWISVLIISLVGILGFVGSMLFYRKNNQTIKE